MHDSPAARPCLMCCPAPASVCVHCSYSVFYNMFPDNRPRQPVGPPPPAARPTVKGAGTTMAAPVAAATAVASPAAKAPVSEAAHGSVSQRKNAAGSPYDI